MSHLIESLDNVLLGSNKPAWHGLGTVVRGQPTSAEALRLAKLDWTVSVEPVCLPDGNGGFIEIPESFATVRDDLARTDYRRALGVVGNRYVPIQNSEGFDIADEIAGAAGARFETAGSLRNGKTVFMTMVMPDSIKVVDDTILPYILISTTHDGTGSEKITYTPTRVVCANTLAVALSESAKIKSHKSWSIRHTANKNERTRQAVDAIKRGNEYFGRHADSMRGLAAAKVDSRFASAFAQALFPDPKEKTARNSMPEKRAEIGRLFSYKQKGANQAAAKGTAYGLFNALAEYIDHSRGTRVVGNATAGESRFDSTMFGSGAALKQAGYGLLTRVLELEPAGKRDAELDALCESFDLALSAKNAAVNSLMDSISFN